MLFLSIFKRFLRRQPLPGRTVIAPKSTQNEYKFITKTYQKHDTFRNRLLVRFSFIFEEENTSRGQPGGATWGRLGPSWGILGASWGHLGTVLGCFGGLPILTPFFNRFFIDVYLQLRSPGPSKSLFFLRKNKVFSKNRCSDLGSIFT